MNYIQSEASRPEFYLIEEGRVKIALLSKDGSERTVIIQERNTLFGYAPLLTAIPFPTATAAGADGTARGPRRHLSCPQRQASEVVRRHHRRLCQGDEDADTPDRERLLHGRPPAGRSHALQARFGGGPDNTEGHPHREEGDPEDLGNLTGLSRVSVSLALNHFEETGPPQKERNMIEIFNVEKLRTVAGLS